MKILHNEDAGLFITFKDLERGTTFSYTVPRYVEESMGDFSEYDGDYVEIDQAEARQLLEDNYPEALEQFNSIVKSFTPHTPDEAQAIIAALGNKEVVVEGAQEPAKWPLDFSTKRYVVNEPLVERWAAIDSDGHFQTTFPTEELAERHYPHASIILLREVR